MSSTLERSSRRATDFVPLGVSAEMGLRGYTRSRAVAFEPSELAHVRTTNAGARVLESSGSAQRSSEKLSRNAIASGECAQTSGERRARRASSRLRFLRRTSYAAHVSSGTCLTGGLCPRRLFSTARAPALLWLAFATARASRSCSLRQRASSRRVLQSGGSVCGLPASVRRSRRATQRRVLGQVARSGRSLCRPSR